ncbi:vesicle-associated membrane protein [Acrasis kona]|uniref:Vesicle-associated membrane protein n=1 Tax=Acrasis kona TaxID=1008807 RepID=A0AAW2Z0H4_9EUKA
MTFIKTTAIAYDDKFVVYPKDDKELIQKFQKIKDSASAEDHKKILKEGIHFSRADGVIYICQAGSQEVVRVCQAFLKDAEEKFTTSNKSESSTKKLLKQLMMYHNDPSNDNILKNQAKVDETKEQMIDNLDKVMINHEKTAVLNEQADDLAHDTKQIFHRNTKKLTWYKRVVIAVQDLIHKPEARNK